MTTKKPISEAHHERVLLAALAACCVLPMIGIVVLTSVLGFAIGPAAAISIGVIAAAACVAIMTRPHHRRRAHDVHETAL